MKPLYLTTLFCAYLGHSMAQYYTYASPYNQINQTIIETSDGGFLIASAESCYTPDEFMIEGCPVGLFLIKTTGNGDTTWTSRIINDDAQGLVNVFQNEDGTYSVIAFQDNTYICDEWVIG